MVKVVNLVVCVLPHTKKKGNITVGLQILLFKKHQIWEDSFKSQTEKNASTIFLLNSAKRKKHDYSIPRILKC